MNPLIEAAQGSASLDTLSATVSTAEGSPSRQTPTTRLPCLAGYEILRELGRGGMAVVYLARQTNLGRLVAVKMLADACSSEAQRRFHGEAEAVASLQHPNIVQVFEWGEAEGRACCALEFIDGGNLAEALAGTPCPPRVAADLVAKLADAVAAAHERCVVHRDLKPANVLLAFSRGSENREDAARFSEPRLNEVGMIPKITDFGLARRLDAPGLTQSGAVVGMPSYMAPEQAEGQKVGPACDIYALGAILYECVTGRPPLLGSTTLETLRLVLNQDPVPPRRLNAEVPRDLETICLKCLSFAQIDAIRAASKP
jgi:serine/threonine protein kinase